MENVPSSNDYEGGFASVLMRKDLGLALNAAKTVEAPVPFTASAHELFNFVDDRVALLGYILQRVRHKKYLR